MNSRHSSILQRTCRALIMVCFSLSCVSISHAAQVEDMPFDSDYVRAVNGGVTIIDVGNTTFYPHLTEEECKELRRLIDELGRATSSAREQWWKCLQGRSPEDQDECDMYREVYEKCAEAVQLAAAQYVLSCMSQNPSPR